MILKRLRLTNFRAFDHICVDFSPLTVFFGPSGSGKSSILYALAMLRQSWRSASYDTPLTFQGTQVDLESLKTVGWRGKATLQFEMEWEGGVSLSFQVKTQRGTGLVVDKNNFQFSVGSRQYRVSPDSPVSPLYFSYDVDRSAVLSPDVQDLSRALDSLNAALTEFFSGMRYISAQRRPRRSYKYSGENPESVGPNAQFLLPFLYRHPSVRDRVEEWLRNYYRQEVRLIVGEKVRGSGILEAYLKDNDTKINLVDSGLGVSLTVPVVAEVLGSPYYSTLLIEQPELGADSSLVSGIANLFLLAVQENRRLIVDTSSEALVAQIRERAPDAVSTARVRIYEVYQQGTGQSRIRQSYP